MSNADARLKIPQESMMRTTISEVMNQVETKTNDKKDIQRRLPFRWLSRQS